LITLFLVVRGEKNLHLIRTQELPTLSLKSCGVWAVYVWLAQSKDTIS
jgi:hypothetical protein